MGLHHEFKVRLRELKRCLPDDGGLFAGIAKRYLVVLERYLVVLERYPVALERYFVAVQRCHELCGISLDLRINPSFELWKCIQELKKCLQTVEFAQNLRLLWVQLLECILRQVHETFCFGRKAKWFPNRRRPPCSTMPWMIRPSLVVLWGVCWMFYGSPSQSAPCMVASYTRMVQEVTLTSFKQLRSPLQHFAILISQANMKASLMACMLRLRARTLN